MFKHGKIVTLHQINYTLSFGKKIRTFWEHFWGWDEMNNFYFKTYHSTWKFKTNTPCFQIYVVQNWKLVLYLYFTFQSRYLSIKCLSFFPYSALLNANRSNEMVTKIINTWDLKFSKLRTKLSELSAISV